MASPKWRSRSFRIRNKKPFSHANCPEVRMVGTCRWASIRQIITAVWICDPNLRGNRRLSPSRRASETTACIVFKAPELRNRQDLRRALLGITAIRNMDRPSSEDIISARPGDPTLRSTENRAECRSQAILVPNSQQGLRLCQYTLCYIGHSVALRTPGRRDARSSELTFDRVARVCLVQRRCCQNA